MKRLILLLTLLCCGVAGAQSAHTVTLSWQASPSASSNPSGSYHVYRFVGSCTLANPTWGQLTSMPSTSIGYVDSAVAAGTDYCYAVTFALNGVESNMSNLSEADVPAGLLPPVNLTAVPK